MRRILWAVLPLLMGGFFMSAWAGTCGNGYTFSRQIKLRKAVGSDQTNFPVPLVGTYAPLKTVANGGQVQNTATNSIGVTGLPADLVFADAASGGNCLKYEVAYYDATTGAFEIWVQQPTLHTASNDSIYMFANNSAVVTSQQDLSMWSDINAKSIYHLPNGSTLGAKDSTGTFNGTVGSATATAGILDGAANVSAGPVSTGNAQNVAGSVTTIAWVNLTTYGNNCHGILDNIASGNGYGLDMNPACVTLTGKIYSTVASGGTFQFNESNESIPSGRWTQVAMTQTGSGRSNNHIYLQGAEVTYNGHSSGSSSIGTSAGTLKIGPDIVSTKFFPGSIDEAQIYTDVKSANWIATASAMQGGQSSAYQIVESSYYTPTIAQFTSCATTDMTVGSFSCVMPFPVTSTGYMIYVLGNTNVSCTTKPTDGLGLTLTQQNTAHFTGTLQEYYDCVYTAPITSTGADTITSGTGNYTAVIYELKGVTTTGIATTSDGSNSPPSAMSATCGGATCFLLCSVNLTNSTGPTYDTYGNSQGYTQAVSPEALPLANDHRAQTYTAYGTVASGSQTCTLSGTGQAGTLTLLPVSATTSTKRRPSQVY